MARSVHDYLRGTTRDFYVWLTSSDAPELPTGLTVWICGDCHWGNLGPTGDADGRGAIRVRDVDQATLSNPAFDLCRLGLSLAVMARGSDLPGEITTRLLEALLAGYVAAGDPDQEAPPSSPLLRTNARRAYRRTVTALARERTGGSRLHLPRGKDFWPLTREERGGLAALCETPEIQALATQLRRRERDAPVTFADAAYWRKGLSSLGRPRYAVLLDVDASAEGKDFCLLDIKAATDSDAPQVAEVPADPGARVVAAARHLSPELGQRMNWVHLNDAAFAVREVLPQDLKLDLTHLTPRRPGRWPVGWATSWDKPILGNSMRTRARTGSMSSGTPARANAMAPIGSGRPRWTYCLRFTGATSLTVIAIWRAALRLHRPEQISKD